MNFSRIFTLLLIASIVFASCKKEEVDLTLNSVLSGTTDLNGATAATNVSVSNDIVFTFSTDIDAATATSTTVSLKRGTTAEAITVTASGKTMTVNPNADLQNGTKYTLAVDGLKSAEGQTLSAVSITFTTEGIGFDTPPQAASQTMYLPLNGSILDITGNATAAFEQVAYTTDRFGKANGAANFRGATAAGNGDIVELSGSQFVHSSNTISFWFKVAGTDYVAPGNKPMFGIGAENGYFFEMGDGSAGPGWIKFATNHKIDPDPKEHGFGTAWNDVNGSQTAGGSIVVAYTGSVTDLVADAWHQMVITFDAATYTKSMYVDGALIQQWNLKDSNNEWNLRDMMLKTGVEGIDAKLTLGFFCSRANTATGWATYSTATNTFKGALDDFRIFNKVLTATEVSTLYTAEKN